MNSQRAREILLLHRPGVMGAFAETATTEPLVAEALTLAQHNPELGRWFEGHRALDNAIRASLRGITAPAGLAERILADHREATAPAEVCWRRWPLSLVAIATAIIFILGAAAIFGYPKLRSVGEFTSFRDEMTACVARDLPMRLRSRDRSELRAF